MVKSEFEKMQSGDWYTCIDAELEALRMVARRAVHMHNSIDPESRGASAQSLSALFASTGSDIYIESPFHCSYGINISIGNNVYINAGCVILDSGSVKIGERSMLGPNVQIYCADHHRDPILRSEGQEVARPVLIGDDVWIGGGAVILPGVTIGDCAIVGAGSVVTKDIAPNAIVAGNPARSISKV